MPPLTKLTTSTQSLRAAVSRFGSLVGAQQQQHEAFYLPALQQRFATLGSYNSPVSSPKPTPGGSRPRSTSASSAMDEMVDADIDISDPPEAVGASNAATARAARERRGSATADEGSNKVLYADLLTLTPDIGMMEFISFLGLLYASIGTVALLGLYSIFGEPGVDTQSDIVNPAASAVKSMSPNMSRVEVEADPTSDARGRTSPLSGVKARQKHDLPAHAPGGDTLEFKSGRF
ncbi:hypothetical protein B0H66DRAFT_626477 [Apodospora peruviana]|uniref:Uncharacterized protein n=1 Tax=Apodospora peruviana TaxID=516989 RepID=A0AAE0I1M9_9PEZI|nr:hypothetical protein B0H66DRAFT_626477 [Apodospora peruviana]